MKQKALVLAEMQSFLNKRQEEDEALRRETDEVLATLNKCVLLSRLSSFQQ